MKVGLVQQKNTADIPANIQKLQDNIRKAAAMGAELVVLQELHNGLYFCQTENTELFNQAEPIPGPSTETFGKLAKELGIVLVLSLFERRAPGLYHNTAVVLEKTAALRVNIGRCTFRMIRLITRSSILRREIWDLNRLIHLSVGWVFWFVGINGIRKQPD